MKTIVVLLLLFPLSGALLNALGGRRLPRRLVEFVACAAVLGAFVVAAVGFAALWQKTFQTSLFEWIVAGSFSASFSILYNPLAAVMALMVTFTELLSTLIGDSLTKRLLNPVWALPSPTSAQETKS